jgi:hypothetical protein
MFQSRAVVNLNTSPAQILHWDVWEFSAGGVQMTTMQWISVIIGIWLIISPWVIGFTGNTGAFWNAIIVGAVLIIIPIWLTYAVRRPTP